MDVVGQAVGNLADDVAAQQMGQAFALRRADDPVVLNKGIALMALSMSLQQDAEKLLGRVGHRRNHLVNGAITGKVGISRPTRSGQA